MKKSSVVNRRSVAPVAVLSAVALFILCLIPLLTWGNPFPSSVWTYWGGGSAIALLVAWAAAKWPSVAAILPLQRAIDFVAHASARRFAAAVMLLASGLSALFALVTFKGGASTSDELAQLWHARILLTGRWFLPRDANPEFFGLDTVVDADRWYSQFPIGGPLLLALGTLLGAPWIVNTLLCGLAAVAMYLFARRAFNESVGRTVALVFAVAPSIVIMAGTMMNHVPALFCAVCILALLVEWDANHSLARSLLCAAGIGVCLGFMASVRPLDALVMVIVVATFQLVVFAKNPRRLREWTVQGVAGLVGAAPMLLANAATTRNPLRFAYDVQWGSGHNLGFHPDPYGRPFTVAMGFDHIVTYVGELNMFVTAWPMPVMAMVIVSLCCIRRASRWDVLLLSLFFAQLLAHGAYWGSGEFLGPRFLFTCLPTIIVLIARLPHLLHERLGAQGQRAIPYFFATGVLFAWGVPNLPMNSWGLSRIARSARQSMRVNPERIVNDAGVHYALVFLREPFSARLTRRMWGLGVPRSHTAQLLWQKDACALHEKVREAEQARASNVGSTNALPSLASAAAYVEGPRSMQSTDGVLQLSSPASLTGACRAEFDSDSLGGFVPFGVGLPLLPINAAGRIDGDVIYAADLGEANERLRSRFGDRQWYRLTASAQNGGRLEPVLTPYVTLAKLK